MDICIFCPVLLDKGSQRRARQIFNSINSNEKKFIYVDSRIKMNFNNLIWTLPKFLPLQIIASLFLGIVIGFRSKKLIIYQHPQLSSILFFVGYKISSFYKNTQLIIDWDDWYGKTGIDSYITRFTVHLLPKIAKEFIVLNDMLDYFINDYYQKKTTLIPMWIPNRIKLDNDEIIKHKIKLNLLDKFIVIHSGIGRMKKILPFLINISKNLEDNITLIITGNIPVIINKENIIFTGYLNNNDLHAYLSISDLAILPLFNDHIDKMRYVSRIGDYLNYKIPIITSNIGSTGKLLKNHNCVTYSEPNYLSYTALINKIYQTNKYKKINCSEALMTKNSEKNVTNIIINYFSELFSS